LRNGELEWRLRSPPFGFWVYFTAWDLESCNRQSERPLVGYLSCLMLNYYELCLYSTQILWHDPKWIFNELPDTSEPGPHWKPHFSMNIKEAFRMLKLLRWLLCTSCFAAESASETLELFHYIGPSLSDVYQNRRRRVHFAKMARILAMKKNNWPDKENMMINDWLWMIYHIMYIYIYYIHLYPSWEYDDEPMDGLRARLRAEPFVIQNPFILVGNPQTKPWFSSGSIDFKGPKTDGRTNVFHTSGCDYSKTRPKSTCPGAEILLGLLHTVRSSRWKQHGAPLCDRFTPG